MNLLVSCVCMFLLPYWCSVQQTETEDEAQSQRLKEALISIQREWKEKVKISDVFFFCMVKFVYNSNYFKYLRSQGNKFQVITLKHELPKTTMTRSTFS